MKLSSLLASSLVVSLAVAGCGGADDSTSDTTPQRPADGGEGGSSGKAQGGSSQSGKAGQSASAGSTAGGASGGSSQGGASQGGAGGDGGTAQGGKAGSAQAGSSQTGGGGSAQAGAGGSAQGGKAGSAQGGSAQAGASGAGGAACPSGTLCGAQGACCAEGDECVAGACVAACASGVRCGAQSATCCAAGDVCIAGSCKTPEGDCLDSIDCGEGKFCEPTLGKCVPQVEQSASCSYIPPQKPLAPVLKWSFTSPTALPSYDQGVSAPLVIDIDGDGAPEVITSTKNNPPPESEDTQGYVRVLDGKTGAEKWAEGVEALSAAGNVDCSTAMAAADLDGNGKVAIVARAVSGELIALDADGSIRWRSTAQDGSSYASTVAHSAIAVADMDADGHAEIVVGGVIFSSQGVVIAGAGNDAMGGVGYNDGSSPYGVSSIIADVDGDGVQDVVTGYAALRLDGSDIFRHTELTDGLPAIADLDGDGAPELVVSAYGGVVRVQDAKTGDVLHQLALGGLNAGPPVIADFDGDGVNEIGVQQDKPCDYTVLEYDKTAGLSVKWNKPLSVCSGFFADTAFDFNGDGSVEVVVHDDCFIIIFDGKTGERLLDLPAPHNTWSEFVSIADVDGDNSAELIFTANDSYHVKNPTYCPYDVSQLRHGVFVYGDIDGAWMPTRRVWNQQSYHITNIRADGSLPKPEPASFGPEGFNNYRVSFQGRGVYNAPDLQVDLEASTKGCPDTINLRARVRNEGALGVLPGVAVAFYEGQKGQGTLVGISQTKTPLLPGASEIVELPYTPQDASTALSFYVVVDDGSDVPVAECIETNNDASLGDVYCGKF